MKKILFATVVPFWNRETGAQQRIFSMVKVLESHGRQVRVFFPAHVDAYDRRIAEQLDLDISFQRSDQPAATGQSLTQKIKWQLDAVKHAVGQAVNFDQLDTEKNQPLTLSDFRWPWAEAAFQNEVIEFAPDAIISEYVTMAYLVESLPVGIRSEIHCLVDTHDLLSRRQQQFADHDRPHWIDISVEEEAAALNIFDTVIAIQEDEAAEFKRMASQSTVIVVGHQTIAADAIDFKTEHVSEILTLGYLGSKNASNVDAINQFLDVVWRNFQNDPRVRLVLAGDASGEVLPSLRFKNLQLLGRVGDVRDFYREVDAVVNPVGYGTGLKIKSVEAIAFGKPLLCTAAGWTGRRDEATIVVNQLPEMTHEIEHWLENHESFERIRKAACTSSKRLKDLPYQSLTDVL